MSKHEENAVFIVWGKLKIQGSSEIKLISFEKRNSAVNWIKQNKNYYDDMKILLHETAI